MSLPPPSSTLFPYTTLFRSIWSPDLHLSRECQWWKWQKNIFRTLHHHPVQNAQICHLLLNRLFYKLYPNAQGDRKSTRLNSSHLGISYAVFCLKKKKHKK